MRAIKDKDTVLEKDFRKILRRAGYSFKSNVARLAGKPDIVFLKQRVIIFLDSCFWHGCKKHCRLPGSNQDYWKAKIERNKKRDKEINKLYRPKKWALLRFWEHQLKKNTDICLNKVKKQLKASD